MVENDRWVLPEGIEEILPPEADKLEQIRRQLLDLYNSWGYELVIPPFIEFLESLLTGTGNDLNLQTFKLTDQLTGRMMGVRADMTPQVARIDAHRLHRDVPSRLCYLGTVLHTRPQVHGGTRSPMQVGAELYGHAGVEADQEILRLMVETLRLCGMETVYLDLGHVGVFRNLARAAELPESVEHALFDALQRKAKPEIDAILDEANVAEPSRQMLLALADLNGDVAILDEAEKTLSSAGEEVKQVLAELRRVAEAVSGDANVRLHVDLAELRGYHYHTGVVFAAFMPGQGQAIAKGGRYDEIGKVFGRARPATGFSADLRSLLALLADDTGPNRGIFAPCADKEGLAGKVAELRASGKRVVEGLPGQSENAGDWGCDQQLLLQDGNWVVADV